MKRRVWLWLAAASLLTAAHAATRPRYGGVLRVAVRESLSSYEPAAPADQNTVLRAQLAELVFDRLVELDARGEPQPGLATSWQPDADFRRWQFHLRSGVTAHDGSVLTAGSIAAALAGERSWRVRVLGDEVMIESDAPRPNLLAELALPRHSIAIRAAAGTLVGTGPFRVATWQPRRAARLVAFDEHWAGRPYVDAIEITMGRSFADQALDRQLGRADVTQLPLEAAERGSDAERSAAPLPREVIGVLWSASADDDRRRLRDALGFAIDRHSLIEGVLGGRGEPAGSLLPQWVSGYAFLFPTAVDRERARELRGVAPATPLTIAFDSNDAVARLIVERLAVNARDAAVRVQPVTEQGARTTAEGRIVRLRVASPIAAVALAEMAGTLGQDDAAILSADSDETLYGSERALLRDARFLPVVFVPELRALGRNVRNWEPTGGSASPFANAWLAKEAR
jgi:hypothetical protein